MPTILPARRRTESNDGALALLSQTRDYEKPQAAAKLTLGIKDFGFS
jgi:hypothetical protein